MAEFFEFTKNGIKLKSFQEIRTALQNDWKNVFGAELDVSPTSPDGHQIDLESKTINSIVEGIQVLVDGFNIHNATGQFLDLLAAFKYLNRAKDESDDVFRDRILSAEVRGLATYTGMITHLKDAIGPNITLNINDENETCYGMPPHSVNVVVPSSCEKSNNDIADAIWACKPAGIKASGNVNTYATDIYGIRHPISFSRPEDILIDVSIALYLYNEESFPNDGKEQVRQAILDWANGEGNYKEAEFTPGKDVIPARFFVPMFSVSGIKNASIRIKKHDDEEWTNNAISIDSNKNVVLNDVTIKVASYG